MKRIIIAALFISVVVPACSGQTLHENSGDQAVADAERRWEEALKRFDTKAMQSLLCEDDLQTDFRGVVQDKASWMQDFQRVAANVHSGKKQWKMSFDDEKVRVYGDLAVITGRGTFNGRRNDAPVNHVIRFTNVWVKRRGAWQLVNYQATPIAP